MKNRRFNTASFMENLWGERHSTSRVHLISVGIHFDIFWEKIIAIRNIFGGWAGTENGILWKKSINHQSCSFQRSDQHKSTKKCTKSQIFAERQIQFFLNYHVFHFILSYIILFYHFFAYLFIYLFYLKLTPEKKKSPLPLPDRGFSFCRLFRELRPPWGLASIFYRIDYGGSENSPLSHCLYLQRRWTTRKGSGHSLQKPKIRTLTSERTGTV